MLPSNPGPLEVSITKMNRMTVENVKRTDTGPALMRANEAVVRGALEADVKVVAFYPGNSPSETLDTVEEVH